jgi:hypothetical protein
MANADYDAKFMRWIYKFLPYIGAFMVFSQVLGPVVNLARYTTGEKIQAQFVSKVRFATTNSTSRGIGQSECAYNYRVPGFSQDPYLISGCFPAFGRNPLPGDAATVVVYQQDPPRIVSHVSLTPDWMRLMTALMGLMMLLLARPLIRRYAK